MSFFSSRGWESWDIANRPLIPERMPVLIDDDLLFEDGPGAPRPSVAVSQWLRELPASGAPAPATWEAYARAVREWIEFLGLHGVGVFGSREQLKAALSRYAEHRAAGPARQRFSATTWGRHMSILSLFYRWAMDEGHAQAEPFTYRTARALFAGTGREVKVNLAVRRTPRPHVTIRYLEPDFTAMFLAGLRGLTADGTADAGYHGRELARNAAVGGLALATGLRLREFTYLLSYEIPAMPPRPTAMPVPFPVPAAIAKGRKFRTTWISYEALAGVRQYLELDRAVAPDGGSCLLAVKNGGGPFTAWPAVFERTSDRIRARSEPRFPHVFPHRLRHTFSMRTLEYLVSGHYRQAAKLVTDADADAALVFYLSKADPLLVLRDLLGHSSVLTTEKYIKRLDTTRMYREAYEHAGLAGGAAAEREASAEFGRDAEGGTR